MACQTYAQMSNNKPNLRSALVHNYYGLEVTVFKVRLIVAVCMCLEILKFKIKVNNS